MRPSTRNLTWLALAGIFALALWLRAWGLTFGLPFDYHVDEFLYSLTARVSRERIHGLFGPFQIIVLALRKLLVPVLGQLDLPADVAATVQSATSFQLVARWVSALLGAATTIPLFLIGKRLWNEAVGLIAAALLAVCFVHARASHYGVPDAAVCFLTVLGAYYCTRFSPAGPVRPYLLAGLCAGLAFPTKMVSWPIFGLIALLHLFPAEEGSSGPEGAAEGRPRLGRLLSGRLAAAYATALAAFLLAAPQWTLHLRATLAWWKSTYEVGAQGGMDRIRLDDGPVWRFYLGSLDWGMGTLLLAASLAGVVLVLVRRRPRQVALMLCFPILYCGFLLLPGNMYFARYALSAVPFLLLAAGDLVWSGLGRLPLPGRARVAAAALATAVLAFPTARDLVLHDRLLAREDTRTLAKRWIEDQVPEGSAVLLESWWFGPQLASEKRPVPFSRRTYAVRLLGPYGLSERSQSFGPSAGTPTLDEYVEQGIEYVVSNSITADSHLLDAEEDRAKREFYRMLDREADLVQKLSPYEGSFEAPRVFEHTYGPATFLDRMVRPGPVVRIYRLRQPEG